MIEISAPAKINLFLYVLNRREDGYHELVTRMQKIDLCDRVEISPVETPGIQLSCDHKSLPEDNKNLAVIAARKFLKAAGPWPHRGIRIRLEKNIPIAAGLGGGSSDAGAVLKGLNSLIDNPLPSDQLIDIAKTIGADVPFFAVEHTAVVATGIGEYLSPVADIEGFWILLVNPGISVSTRSVFENYALTTLSKNSKVTSFEYSGLSSFSPEQMHNDLEPVTLSSHPVIDTIKHSLIEAGAAAAMMSGSGPTLFGLFPIETFTASEISKLVDQFILVYGPRVYATRTYAGA